MPTATTIINQSLSILGVIAQGELPSASEYTDSLAVLNMMLDNWSTEKLNVPYRLIYNGALANGTNNYLIASGSTFNTPRPTRIVSARSVNNGVGLPVQVIAQEDWANIVDQTATGPVVKMIYYDQASPIGKIYTYPTPNAVFTLELYLVAPLATFPDLVSNIDVITGYQRAVVFNLAVELASIFGQTMRPDTQQIANESKAAIRKMNAENLGPDQTSGPTNALGAPAQAGGQ